MAWWIVLLIVVAAVVVVAVCAYALYRQRQQKQSEELRDAYGPEYDRAREQYGRRTDKVLADRQERLEQYDIRPLSDEDRSRFQGEFDEIQRQFVDDPAGAVGRADTLIGDTMVRMGYPASDFNRTQEVASLRYPETVED